MATDQEDDEIDLIGATQQRSLPWHPGLSVQTPYYGWGTLRRRRPPPPQGDGMLEVRLEWNARGYLRPEAVLDRCVSTVRLRGVGFYAP